MMDLLKYLDARLGEPSTYAGIAALLVAAHVNLPTGIWSDITLYGPVIAAALAVVLSEQGKKSPAQIAADALAAAQGAKTTNPPTGG
ncbi:MAG: hypothetical protein KGL39_50200 [Patescibacteria group bacterium]|nr:hypothetical protein [Patescibacteria group bacterium]